MLCAKSAFFVSVGGVRNKPVLPTALLAGFCTIKGKLVLFYKVDTNTSSVSSTD